MGIRLLTKLLLVAVLLVPAMGVRGNEASCRMSDGTSFWNAQAAKIGGSCCDPKNSAKTGPKPCLCAKRYSETVKLQPAAVPVPMPEAVVDDSVCPIPVAKAAAETVPIPTHLPQAPATGPPKGPQRDRSPPRLR